MSTMPATTAVAPSARASRRVRGGIARVGSWAILIALIVGNAWLFWRDRPTLDLKTLGRQVGGPQSAEAESELRRIVRKSPHDADALLLLARALATRGQTASCAEVLHRVPFWSPRKAEALYAEMLSWLEADRARLSEQAALDYLDDDPNHPYPRPNRGKVEETLLNLYALEDRWDDARDLIWRAYDASSGPSGRQLWTIHAARTHLERSNPAVAIRTLRRYVAADPQDWEARRALARAADKIGEAAEADSAIEACLAARPNDPRVWRDRLAILEARGDLPALEKASAGAPPEADSEGEIWMVRGKLHRQARDLVGAVEAYRRAVALLPNQPSAHYQLALSEQALGHVQAATAHRARHAFLEGLAVKFSDAFNAFLDAEEARPRKPEDVKKAALRLSDMSRNLGWTREADAWTRLAAEE